MKAKVVALLVAGTVALATANAGTAQAHQGHASCRAWGEFVSDFARENRPSGQLVSANPDVSGGVAILHTALCEHKP